VALDEEDDRVT